MKLKIDESDVRVLKLIDEFFGQVVYYLRFLDIDHIHLWKNDGLNENHVYLRMVTDVLQKIRNEIPNLSPAFKSRDPEFIDSLRKIGETGALVWLERDGVRFFIDQEIPDMIKYMKAVFPESHIALSQLNK